MGPGLVMEDTDDRNEDDGEVGKLFDEFVFTVVLVDVNENIPSAAPIEVTDDDTGLPIEPLVGTAKEVLAVLNDGDVDISLPVHETLKK